MPGVVRLGDNGSGHECYPPRPSIEASENVFANSKGVVRVGDKFDVHCCDDECHDGVAEEGSPTVFANSKAVFRKGDKISCGSFGDECSPDVFA